MALAIFERLTPTDQEYIEDLTIRETWTEVRTLEEDGENTVYFEKGTLALYVAEEFLHLLDTNKYQRLKQIKNDVKQREKEKTNGYDYDLTVEEVQEIYKLIKDIPSRYDELLYDFVRIRPEKIAVVEQTAPYLVRESRPYAAPRDKEVVKIIDNAQWQTNQLIKFFGLAARLGNAVWVATDE